MKRLGEFTHLLLPQEALGVTRELTVNQLVMDSRKVSTGDCFLAVPGFTVDGRNFIDAAIAQGAAAVLAEGETMTCGWNNHVPLVQVPDLNNKLSALAGNFYDAPSQAQSVFAVTGTNAKTTCSHLYAQWRKQLADQCGLIGTLGCGVLGDELSASGMTTPDAIEVQRWLAHFLAKGATHSALEASSHSLDQGRISALDVNTAVFTNLSRDHLDYHGTMDAYADAKWKLFSQFPLQHAVINIDDSTGAKWSENYQGNGELLTYSIANPEADVFADNIEYQAQGLCFQLVSPFGSAEIQTALVGEFNVSNVLAVSAALLAEGVAIDELAATAGALEPVNGRMQFLPGAETTPTVVIDYAHTPDSLEQALKSARRHCLGKLWCVFGCGGDRDRGKRSSMAKAAIENSDCIIVTNDNPRTEDPQQILSDTIAGFEDYANVDIELDRARAIALAVATAEADDLIVVAGKGHEDYQIIGDQVLPFLDANVALAAIARREGRVC